LAPAVAGLAAAGLAVAGLAAAGLAAAGLAAAGLAAADLLGAGLAAAGLAAAGFLPAALGAVEGAFGLPRAPSDAGAAGSSPGVLAGSRAAGLRREVATEQP
jgi:hypothetical protein